METLNTMMSRHSVRTYTGEVASDEAFAKILTAAKSAPVGMGLYDQMHLTVVKNPEFIAAADHATAVMMNDPESHPLYGVPTLVFVSAKKQIPMFHDMMVASAGMIAHSMVLEAVEQGLGGVYLWGMFNAVTGNPDLYAQLNLPEDSEILAAVGIGVTDDKYEVREVPADKIATNVIE